MATVLLMAGSVGMARRKDRHRRWRSTRAPHAAVAAWVDHLRSHGFTVRTINTDTIDELKTSRGVPREVRSCHTALVGGYVVERHVPVADVQRLLKERPAILGIAVPGMPIGSPGMEVSGRKAQSFNVMAFAKDGSTRVFASH